MLLFRGGDPASLQKVWFTPGGEVEAGETDAEAAIRELREEAAIVVGDVNGPVARGRVVFRVRERLIDQQQVFFVARVTSRRVQLGAVDQTEAETLLDHRWGTPEAMRASLEQFVPQGLLGLVEDVLSGATSDLVRLADDLTQA